MVNNLIKKDLPAWLIGGLVKSPASAKIEQNLKQISVKSRIIQLDPYGAFFYSNPGYLDWAENEEMMIAKVGFARINDDFTTASDLLHSGYVTPYEIDHEHIHGNTLIFCCSKQEPLFCVYKTLLSVQQFYYTDIDDAIIIANNLGALAEFTRNDKINPKAIPLHLIYRSVPGQITYFSNIFRLRPGEVLYRDGTKTRIVLRNNLRNLLKYDHNAQEVGPDSANVLFEQIKGTMARYLKATSDTEPHWTMLLSGGVDSSVIQMAINSQAISQIQHISHSYAPDIDIFGPELSYARKASDLFGTKHTFITVQMEDYPYWLTQTIKILGQPLHHEGTACWPPMLEYIVKNNPNIKYLFSAQGADALYGLGIAERIARGTQYQHWPPILLYLMAIALKPFSRNEYSHILLAADGLSRLKKNQDAHQYPLNTVSSYTDWAMAYRNFGRAELDEALAYRRQIEIDYLDSPQITEKTQTVDFLSDSYDSAGNEHQLSLAYNEQFIFPFLDDAMVLAAFRFDARDRYFSGGRTKPILKQILEMGPAAGIANEPKRGGGFKTELFSWMRNGILRDLVSSIKRPDFMSQYDFKRIIASPGWYTWNLLTFDLFEKNVVSTNASKHIISLLGSRQ